MNLAPWKMPASIIAALAAVSFTASAQAQEAAPISVIPEAFHGEWADRGNCSAPLVITADAARLSDGSLLYPRERLGSDLIVLARVPDLADPDADEGVSLRLAERDVLQFGALEPIYIRLTRCTAPDMPPLEGGSAG